MGVGVPPSADKPVEPRMMRNSTEPVVCFLYETAAGALR